MILPPRLRQSLVGWIYPPCCASCEIPLAAERQIEVPFLCRDCEDGLVEIPDGYCPACGQSYEVPVGLTVPCGNCGGRELFFDYAISAYRSSGSTREMMHAYKYGKQLHLSRLFGYLLHEVWKDSRLEEVESWWVVPVPLHPRRQRQRGFNQALEIAKEFVASAPETRNLKLHSCLKRTRHTVRQAQLDRKERLSNLKNAFSVMQIPSLEGSPEPGILLIDDVMTTGTTVSECARVLRKSLEKKGSEAPLIVGLTVLRG
ncbi:MAG: ComF family protein [Verrucomicrobiota bacterium]